MLWDPKALRAQAVTLYHGGPCLLSLPSYGTVDSDDPHEMNHFLLEVYQAVLLAVPAAPPVFGHYRELAGLPRLISLVGGQMVHHVGAATDKPMLYLPPEVLALPDDPEERRRLPLDTGLLARTEGWWYCNYWKKNN